MQHVFMSMLNRGLSLGSLIHSSTHLSRKLPSGKLEKRPARREERQGGEGERREKTGFERKKKLLVLHISRPSARPSKASSHRKKRRKRSSLSEHLPKQELSSRRFEVVLCCLQGRISLGFLSRRSSPLVSLFFLLFRWESLALLEHGCRASRGHGGNFLFLSLSLSLSLFFFFFFFLLLQIFSPVAKERIFRLTSQKPEREGDKKGI